MPASTRPALFLDRDGVINEEIGYLHRFADVRFVPGVATLIRTANQLGMPVIVVTNQAGIGRGLYSEQQFHSLMHALEAALQVEGATLDAIYFSPFHPEHGIGEYRRETDCRKPGPGMLLRAAAEHGIDLAESVLVGYRCSDIGAAAAAGVPHRFLLLGTETSPCQCASYQPVEQLAGVTDWLHARFSHRLLQTSSEQAAGQDHAVAS